jgi:membrane protease YdiL (CAAX protease family)
MKQQNEINLNVDGRNLNNTPSTKPKPKLDNNILAVICYFISALVFFAVKVLAALNTFKFLGETGSYLINIFIQVFAIGIIPFLIYKISTKQKTKQIADDLSYKKISYKTVLLSIVIGICVFIGTIIISTLFQALLSSLGYTNPFAGSKDSSSIGLLVLAIVMTAIFPAFFEEFLNRGLLMNGLKKFGVKRAIFFSALLFGLMHFNINQVFYAFLIGLLLGFLTVISKSIWPAIIIHFINNFFSVIFGYLTDNNLPGKQVYEVINFIFKGNFFVALIKCLVVLAALIAIISLCLGKIFKIEKNRQIKNKLVEVIRNFEVKQEPSPTGLENNSDKTNLKPTSNNEADLKNKNKDTLTVEVEDKNYDGEVFVEMEKAIKSELPTTTNDTERYAGITSFMLGETKQDEAIKTAEFKKAKRLKLWLYSSIVLCGAMTVATFIWGLL